MRVVINLALFVLICGLAWTLYSSIQEPIAFNAEKTRRENAVVSRLQSIRAAQGIFKEVTMEGYAPDFDSLIQTLKTGEIMKISASGDKDDPNNPTIYYDTTYLPAVERINQINEDNVGLYQINLDSLKYVPFTNGEVTFEIAADTITYQQTLVDVLEVKTLKANYMGKYKSPRYARYDATYDPKSFIKFGNLSAPNLTGNWE